MYCNFSVPSEPVPIEAGLRLAQPATYDDVTALRQDARRAECLAKELSTGEDLALLPLLLLAAGGKPGVFVELGAFDGVTGSQTLALERCLGWRGVLVEASPRNFEKLRHSGRTASHMFHAAGCAAGSNVTMRLDSTGSTGSRSTVVAANAQGGLTTVPCRELREMVASAGMDEVTFLSLDVQGAEETVLLTTDLKAVRLALVETEDLQPGAAQKNARVRALLKESGLVPHHMHHHYPANRWPHGPRRSVARNELFVRAWAGSLVRSSPELHMFHQQSVSTRAVAIMSAAEKQRQVSCGLAAARRAIDESE